MGPNGRKGEAMSINITLGNNSRKQQPKKIQRYNLEHRFSSPDGVGWENLCLNCGDFSCNGRKFPERMLPKNEEFKNIWICSNFTKIED